MKIQTGIWLDHANAHIVRLENGESHTLTVESAVEDHRVHGGYGGSDAHLSQDSRSDRRLLERKNQQLKKYFQEVIDRVPASSELLIMGPGEVKTGFQQEILRLNSPVEIKEVMTADKMTQNQLVAKVKAFFEG